VIVVWRDAALDAVCGHACPEQEIKSLKKYRHLRLYPETHERLKKQAAISKRTLMAYLEWLALRWEERLLKCMSEDEKGRYHNYQMTFEESERIRQRKRPLEGADLIRTDAA